MKRKLIFTAVFACVTLYAPLALWGQERNFELEREYHFVNEGFGFKYVDDEIEDMELFIARHGKPLHIIEKDVEHLGEKPRDKWGVINNTIITLEYDAVFVVYSKYRRWGDNNYQTLLTKIISKNDRIYMYGIRHGLTITELEKIIGKTEIRRGDEPELILYYNDNRAVISFYGDTIAQIVWLNNVQ